MEKRACTGISGLDFILGGGLPCGHFYLVEGRPGAGKTTLALQFLIDGARTGEAGLYVTLSESQLELEKVAASHGWQLKPLTVFELKTPEEDVLPEGQYTFFHPSEVELGETTKSLLDEVDRVQPVRVVFDSLSEMRLLARDPLRYRRQVLGLKQFFARRGCTVMVLDDLTSSQADLQPQSIAHGVLTLESLAPDFGADRRRLRISKMRGVKFQGGYHDFNILTGGIEVYPRLVPGNHSTEFTDETVPSASREFTALLGGGFERGSSALVMGPAGTGKSTIAVSFAMEAAKRGENATIFVFDETLRTYLRRTAGLGYNIAPYIKKKRIVLHQINPAEMSPGEFAYGVRHEVEDRKARVVVIDSLSGYFHAMPDERFLIIHMHELLSYLSQAGVVTITLLAQHGIIGNRMDYSDTDLSYLADTVIMLRYFEVSGTVRKAISIVKKRSGNHEDTIRELSLSPKGLKVGPPLTEFRGILTGVPVFDGKFSSLEKR